MIGFLAALVTGFRVVKVFRKPRHQNRPPSIVLWEDQMVANCLAGVRKRMDAICAALMLEPPAVFLNRSPLVTAGDDEIIGHFGGQTFQADLILPRVQFFVLPRDARSLHYSVRELITNNQHPLWPLLKV